MPLTRADRRRLKILVRSSAARPSAAQYRAVIAWAEEVLEDYELLRMLMDGELDVQFSQDGSEAFIVTREVH